MPLFLNKTMHVKPRLNWITRLGRYLMPPPPSVNMTNTKFSHQIERKTNLNRCIEFSTPISIPLSLPPLPHLTPIKLCSFCNSVWLKPRD